jgi:hypothetical protein
MRPAARQQQQQQQQRQQQQIRACMRMRMRTEERGSQMQALPLVVRKRKVLRSAAARTRRRGLMRHAELQRRWLRR